MTPKDAVKAIEGLQAVMAVELVAMKPGDVLVVRAERELNENEIDALYDMFRDVLPPGCRVAVLERGLSLQALRAPERP